jgi:hypothetical protein
MKKKILVVIALCMATSISVFAQLKPKVLISYDINPSYTIVQSQTVTTRSPEIINTTTSDVQITYKQPPIVIKYGLEYQYKHLSAYFDNTVYSKMKGNPAPGNFSPQQVTFAIGVKCHITRNIQFNYEHMCTHTVNVQASVIPTTRLTGCYDRFTLSYGY